VGRPRLGPPITFRLPLELHAIIAERAEAHGVTVDEYAQSRWADSLRKHLDDHPPEPETPGRMVNPRWKSGSTLAGKKGS
jgi:hypothetical protein